MKVTVEMDWNTDETTPREHEEALQESGVERALKMINEGYTQGELIDNIHMLDTDPEDGVEYRGWWTLSVERDPKPNTPPRSAGK
ncbi:MAG: hypothetical protein AWU57_594 [Marinobacter sp. T13-3]|nr:MAG: hypothetical protein AWU57_594 [Marinobacter sp. T13-3]